MVTIFKIGDRVQYARQWLRSTGQLAGDVPHATGRIIGLSPVSAGLDIATIEWNTPGLSAKVLTSNLVREDRKHLERV
jgi:hypothetical protein